MQGYIRDSVFDPRRWLAPGQISIRPFPCICGVDTCNVLIERKYMSEEISVVVGKPVIKVTGGCALRQLQIVLEP